VPRGAVVLLDQDARHAEARELQRRAQPTGPAPRTMTRPDSESVMVGSVSPQRPQSAQTCPSVVSVVKTLPIVTAAIRRGARR
jgi:hypothetical protein